MLLSVDSEVSEVCC